VSKSDIIYCYGDGDLSAAWSASEVRASDPITLTLTWSETGCALDGHRIWAQLGQAMAPGCLDLASGRNLLCPGCTSISYDPTTGELLANGTGPVTIDFDAGPEPTD